jgi:hypothetical protein
LARRANASGRAIHLSILLEHGTDNNRFESRAVLLLSTSISDAILKVVRNSNSGIITFK